CAKTRTIQRRTRCICRDSTSGTVERRRPYNWRSIFSSKRCVATRIMHVRIPAFVWPIWCCPSTATYRLMQLGPRPSTRQTALAIDETLAEAHAVLGLASTYVFKNAAAERSFATALSLDSNCATAHFWHALLLGHLGRHDEAISEVRLAH